MHADFYGVMATIIPVMFLALTIQSSDFIRQNNPITKESSWITKQGIVLAVIFLLGLAISELIILYALYKSHNPEFKLPVEYAYAAVYLVGSSSILVIFDYITSRIDLGVIVLTRKNERRIISIAIILLIITAIIAFWGGYFTSAIL